MFIVRTIRLKKHLESLGFKCEGSAPNKYNGNFLVFYFDNTEELVQAVTEFSNK